MLTLRGADAGFVAYRVDQDPGTDVVIAAIERGIRQAAVCLADITSNNPNVWYELGFAYAAHKPVILTCCDDRRGQLPFDIQHRHVIRYQSESPSDFEALKQQISIRAEALRSKAAELQVARADPTAPQDGLPPREIHLLGLVAGETAAPNDRQSVWTLKRRAESSGMTAVAFGLAFRALGKRRLIGTEIVADRDGEYEGAYVTDEGWQWIQEHAHRFNLDSTSDGHLDDMDELDDIPF